MQGLTIVRERQGVSKSELARRSGITRRAIINIENGKHYPHRKTLVKLAAALGCTPFEIVMADEMARMGHGPVQAAELAAEPVGQKLQT